MTPAIRPLIAGNWKMHGTGAALDELTRLKTLLAETGELDSDVLICPPATLVHRAAQLVSGSVIRIGGQDCHAETTGAHTGDISAQMLLDAGASHVILGHSERRADHGESSALVKSKAEAALAAGLIPIICVGETEAQRDAGEANRIVAEQIETSLPDTFGHTQIIVAYEPVWAIGTGKTATPQDIENIHSHMRGLLIGRFAEAGEKAALLYGGSVKPANAAEILRTPDVNGALVGGASLKANDFFSIVVAG